MTQAFSVPVSSVARATATRTAHQSAGGSGPPGTDSETPAFSSVLDNHVARTAHAEGQNKTAGDSGGRRSGSDKGAGHKSSAESTTAGATRRSAAGHRHHRAAATGSQGPGPSTANASADAATHVTRAALAATPHAAQPTVAADVQSESEPTATQTGTTPALVQPATVAQAATVAQDAAAAQATIAQTALNRHNHFFNPRCHKSK